MKSWKEWDDNDFDEYFKNLKLNGFIKQKPSEKQLKAWALSKLRPTWNKGVRGLKYKTSISCKEQIKIIKEKEAQNE